MARANRSNRFLAYAACAVGLLCTLSALPALADVLVLQDGTQVKTQGPWKVDGRMIVFTTDGGRLASLQAKLVDLDASKTATEQAAAAAEAAKMPKPEPAEVKSVLVITDADVAHVGPRAVADMANGEGNDSAEKPEAQASTRVVVTDWQRAGAPDGNGVVISGQVKNQSTQAVGNVTVEVSLFDADGNRVGGTSVSAQPASLTPGADGTFEATLTDVADFVSARFQTRETALEIGQPQEASIPQLRRQQQESEETAQPEE